MTGGHLKTLAFLAVATWVVPSNAQQCPGHTHIVLVDQTTAYDQQDIDAIKPLLGTFERSVAEGDRIVIRTVADTSDRSETLFDGCLPSQGNGIWAIVMNPLSTLADRRAEFVAFVAQYRQAIDSIVRINPDHRDLQATALLATISTHAAGVDQIWLLSDLLESAAVPAHELITTGFPDGATLQLKPGAVVHAAGYGRFHDKARRPLTDEQERVLIDAWRVLVERSGATFVCGL